MEESRQGYYLDPILTVDAASLRPRLMRTYNLSPHTLLPDVADRRIPHASLTVSPDRKPLRFVAAPHCHGLLPRVLDTLLQDRKRVTMGYVGRLHTPTGKIFDQSSGRPQRDPRGRPAQSRNCDFFILIFVR